jgi:hypothetical protein
MENELEDLEYLVELSETMGEPMKKAYVIFDKDGIVFATHSWEGENPPEECPIATPEGGSAVAMEQGDANLLMGLPKGGQRLTVIRNGIFLDGVPVGTIVDGKVELQAHL